MALLLAAIDMDSEGRVDEACVSFRMEQISMILSSDSKLVLLVL